MTLELYTDAALTRDLPEHHLCRGDVVKLVDALTARDGSAGYAVEVFNALGETIGVYTIPADVVEPLRDDQVFCVRRFEAAAAS